MKNFPHQYNDPAKIRAALEVVVALNETGADVRDDGVLGYELARSGVYSFRNLRTDLDSRIERERTKPPSSQGARTAARETRRTLAYLGWIDADGRVTLEGKALLATRPQSEEERAIWQMGLSALELTDPDGNASHPIRVLIRLCRAMRLESRDGMELILVALDDSNAEFERIKKLANEKSEKRREMLGLTQAKVANARKILPSLAEFAGLIARDDSGRYVPTRMGMQAASISSIVDDAPTAAHGRARRHASRTAIVTADSVGAAREFDESNWGSLTHDEQMDAIRLRQERTDRHQELVRVLASSIEGTLRENPASFDLLSAHAGNYCVLWEVKTIDGDAAGQTRRAVSQLLYYRYFEIKSIGECETTAMVVALELPIDEELTEFLEDLGIGAVVIEGSSGRLAPANASGANVLERIANA